MKVGINLFPLTPHAGGIGKFVLSMIRAWSTEETGQELTLFTFPHHRKLPKDTWGGEATVKRLLSPRLLRAAAADCDVYYCPFGRLVPAPAPCPSVVLVMDIQEFFHPSHFNRGERRRRLMAANRSFRHADHVVAISDFCKRSLVDVLGIAEERVSAVPLCASQGSLSPARPPGLDEGHGPFLLYPALDWPHKNHDRLFQALAMVKTKHPQLRLVLTGERLTPRRLEQEARQVGVEDLVTDLGHVTADELAWLYRHATALVFPSLFEGFGMPLVEAMLAGLPIACSNTSSLPEVAGDAAVLFNPTDTCSVADGLQGLLDNETRRQECIERGKKQAQRYAMDMVIREHAAIFRRTAEAPRRTATNNVIPLRDALCGHIPAEHLQRAHALQPRG